MPMVRFTLSMNDPYHRKVRGTPNGCVNYDIEIRNNNPELLKKEIERLKLDFKHKGWVSVRARVLK